MFEAAISSLSSLFKKNELESLATFNKDFDNYLYEVKEWVKDFEAAIQAIQRLEYLEEEICKDKLKIEEMNFANLKSNNKVAFFSLSFN